MYTDIQLTDQLVKKCPKKLPKKFQNSCGGGVGPDLWKTQIKAAFFLEASLKDGRWKLELAAPTSHLSASAVACKKI